MSEALSGKINVTKILKQHLFKGNKGTYLDITIWPNREGEDQYGNTHYITQSLSREAREKGERGPILGNARPIQRGGPSAAAKAAPTPAATPEPDPFPDNEIPF
jgi:hypothetical protein